MGRVVLDADVRAKLNGLNDQVEICDEAGNTLGHFVPECIYKQLLYAWANAQLKDNELEVARAEIGGSSLNEIWKRLGAK